MYESGSTIHWGTYHFCQKPYVSWHQFAEYIVSKAIDINLIDHKVEVLPISSSQFPTSVIRPENSMMDTWAFCSTFDLEPESWVLDVNKVLESEINS